ncbi:MAG: COR domain-containing protein, partial [Candidatus Nitrotoga sp.]
KKIASPFCKRRISQADFFNFPVWPDGMPSDINSRWQGFKTAALDLDPSFDVWLAWYENQLNGYFPNPDFEQAVLGISRSVLEQGPSSYNDQFKRIAIQYGLMKGEASSRPLNQVRAILIGNGAAGKTSLVRKLKGEPVVMGAELMTPGIDIRLWKVGDTDIQAHLWDFGGQVIGHSMHQFFLREDCVYILVLDGRTEFNANDQAEYWLAHVKAFGDSAPVLIVANKTDVMAVNLDMNALKGKYPNIVNHYPLSCTDARFSSQFGIFQQALIEALIQAKTHTVLFNDGEFAVLDKLRKLTPEQSLLPYETFEALCEEHGVGEGGFRREDYLGLLDKLGEVVHFDKLAHLGKFVLNPRWLTYGVYTLLYSDEISQAPVGELSDTQVANILCAKNVKDENGCNLCFTLETSRYIIDAMEEFELCYRLPHDRHRIVFPDKLAASQPDLSAVGFDQPKEGCLQFEFQFTGFLPRHVMPMFTVAHHETIKDKLVWQNGVILVNEHHNTLARVHVDYHDRVLKIWLQTYHSNNSSSPREVLAIYQDKIKTILNRMPALEYFELVVLPRSALLSEGMRVAGKEEKASYGQLLSMAQHGYDKYPSSSGAVYDLNKLLGMIMTVDRKAEQTNTIHFHGNAGAVSVGDHNAVTGTVKISEALSSEDKKKLDTILTKLSEDIINAEGDAKTKMAAVRELNQLQELTQQEQIKPDEVKKAQPLLEKIKNGTAQFFRITKVIKENEGSVKWLGEIVARLLG